MRLTILTLFEHGGVCGSKYTNNHSMAIQKQNSKELEEKHKKARSAAFAILVILSPRNGRE